MANSHKEDQWLRDMEAQQRDLLFPHTHPNQMGFWRRLSERPLTTTTKIGLWLLLLLGWGALVHILLALTNKEVLWPFVLWMLLVWVPIFGGIGWATRRALRNINNERHRNRR
jgi:hypothetical protein